MTKISVNDQAYMVESEPDTPLLWVLRDELQLTGTKFGCGMGLCGACTVHIDGQAMRACQLPLATLKPESRITTIEGLGRNGPHAVQVAWEEINVPQCGYCQAGQIMAAASLLDHSPDPGDKEIDQAMSGNLCRCATYPRIRSAIRRAVNIASDRERKE